MHQDLLDQAQHPVHMRRCQRSKRSSPLRAMYQGNIGSYVEYNRAYAGQSGGASSTVAWPLVQVARHMVQHGYQAMRPLRCGSLHRATLVFRSPRRGSARNGGREIASPFPPTHPGLSFVSHTEDAGAHDLPSSRSAL